MTEHSTPLRKGRLLRLPPRKGLWLFDHDQVKYNTPFQQTVSAILGSLALGFGAVVLWIVWSSRTGSWMDVLLAVAALAYGLLNAPVGMVYWFRRWRGERTEYFDYEVVNEEKKKHVERS